MPLLERFSVVRFARPDSARAPSSPMSLSRKVERGQVDEARQRPRALSADLVARKVQRGEVDEARQRPRALGTDLVARKVQRGQVRRGPTAPARPRRRCRCPERSSVVRLTRPDSARAPSSPMRCPKGELVRLRGPTAPAPSPIRCPKVERGQLTRPDSARAPSSPIPSPKGERGQVRQA